MYKHLSVLQYVCNLGGTELSNLSLDMLLQVDSVKQGPLYVC